MKDFKLYLFIASALLIIYLVAQYNRPKPVNWSQTLVNTDKIPFGTYIIYNRLHDIFPDTKIQTYREPVYNVIADHHAGHAGYIIICDAINLNEYDYDKLAQFIKAGNDVFIAASDYGDVFRKQLKIETRTELTVNKQGVNIRFVNKNLDTTKIYTVDKGACDGYFSALDTSKAIILGQDNFHHADFIKFSMGKGALYLSVNPLMYSNYTLLQPSGATYAATALSYLHNNADLIWDEYYTQGREGEESIMRVFLRNMPLRWAFYIALSGLLIFVLYEMKRRQRVIPVVEPLNNSTVDFVNVVGQVYYEQRDNSNIAQKKAMYFLEHVRARYHLKTSILNNDFVQSLSQKSGVDAAFVTTLINQITLTRAGVHISDRDLISLNQNIEQFYIKSR